MFHSVSLQSILRRHWQRKMQTGLWWQEPGDWEWIQSCNSGNHHHYHYHHHHHYLLHTNHCQDTDNRTLWTPDLYLLVHALGPCFTYDPPLDGLPMFDGGNAGFWLVQNVKCWSLIGQYSRYWTVPWSQRRGQQGPASESYLCSWERSVLAQWEDAGIVEVQTVSKPGHSDSLSSHQNREGIIKLAFNRIF